MDNEALRKLESLYQKLPGCDRSRPPALTDVFVSEVRKFVARDIDEEQLRRILGLSLRAGVGLDDLRRVVNNMTEVGAINGISENYLLSMMPSEGLEK